MRHDALGCPLSLGLQAYIADVTDKFPAYGNVDIIFDHF